MQKRIIFLVIIIMLLGLENCIFAGTGEDSTRSDFQQLKPDSSRKMTSAGICSDGHILITTSEFFEVDTFLYRAILCDTEGRITKIHDFLPTQEGFFSKYAALVEKDCSFPATWLWSAEKKRTWFDAVNRPRCYLEGRIYNIDQLSSKKLTRQLLISTDKDECKNIRKWWHFGQGKSQKIVVEIVALTNENNNSDANADEKKPQYYDSSYENHWLRCYNFDGDKATLVKEISLDDENLGTVEVECGIDGNDIIIWYITDKRNTISKIDFTGECTLRVVKWTDSEELNWIECLKGGRISGLAVDSSYGSVATVWSENPPYSRAPRSVSISDASYIIFNFKNNKVKQRVLVAKASSHGLCKCSYVHLKENGWAVATYENMGFLISVLNKNFELTGQQFIELWDISPWSGYHIVQDEDDLYLVGGGRESAIIVKRIPFPLTEQTKE